MVDLAYKYRIFRAHNRHSYPVLFMAIACGKSALQLGLFIGVFWFALSKLTGGQHQGNYVLEQKYKTVDKSIQFAGIDRKLTQVEIPATAVGKVPVRIREAGTTVPAAKVGVYNADWLLKQDADAYVVQLASSTVKPELFQKAFVLSETYPVVVYPFKKTRNNQLMYGYAIGMYGSFNEAQKGANKLSASAVEEGVWIRSVGEIQKAIVSTRQSAL